MPCSSQYNFFCVTDNIGCFAANNLNESPDYTGQRLGFVFPKFCGSFLQTLILASQYQGICPQDLSCCHGCSGKECDSHIIGSSNQPMIEPQQIAGLPPTSWPESLSPTGFQLAFELADNTIPTVPNAGTPSPPSADITNFGQPSTGAADLLRDPNSPGLPQNIDTNTGKTTSDFFEQAPGGIHINPNLYQKITLPVEDRPIENQKLQPAPAGQENPSFEVPLE